MYHDQSKTGHRTHWGRVTHICVSKLTTIGSDNGLSPGRRQAIIWSNAGILLNWTLETTFSEIFCENAFENVVWKTAAILSRPQCVKKWLWYSGHRVALVVHRAHKSVPDSAGEWHTFLPPPLESCSGTANVDGPNLYMIKKESLPDDPNFAGQGPRSGTYLEDWESVCLSPCDAQQIISPSAACMKHCLK